MNEQNRRFTEVFNKTETEIEFNLEWSNGTGYFDYAAEGPEAPIIAPGGVVKCMTPGNRRMLIVGTSLGNLVIFDRFKDAEGEVFVYNASREIDQGGWLSGTALRADEMMIALGEFKNDNLGHRIERLAFSLKRAEKLNDTAPAN